MEQSGSAAGEYAITRHFESDRGRIINSAAIRRLQQKTQVFPLERNAAVRSRLTHSLEVQQTGRYIAKEILETLKNQGGLEKYGLRELAGAFESPVEMACLLHDVGNPPFGHFGEAAINDWFDANLPAELVDPLIAGVEGDEQRDGFNQLNAMIRQDLCHFEGNAQAIRTVHTLLQLNLTYCRRLHSEIYRARPVAGRQARAVHHPDEKAGLLSFRTPLHRRAARRHAAERASPFSSYG